jgi:aldehyde:ferredoxin oxidoreductase
MKSHAGKILKIDLTNRETEIIPTDKYEKWIGGIGIGAALFFDEVDKDYITDTHDISGFEPENLICVMTGAMCGAMVAGNSKTEVCGIGPETYPRPQFIRSSIGGYFGPMLKYAGYDGMVITGKADTVVWVDIRNGDVQIRGAGHLWGKGFFIAQKEIWNTIDNEPSPIPNHTWLEAATQRSAVLGIGQAGENQCHVGCLLHGADSAAGVGGFGGVFGSKNLKAISVIGTGSVEVAHPEELMETFLWDRRHKPKKFFAAQDTTQVKGRRKTACFGCTSACKLITSEKEMSGSVGQCAQVFYYFAEDAYQHGHPTSASHIATRLAQDYGINIGFLWPALVWLESLHERGLLGKDKGIKTSLDFEKDLGKAEFISDLLRMITFKEDIGADLSGGHVRAAAKWGVLEEDLMSGLISAIHWGIGDQHWTNSMNWAYTSLFDSRDINAHDMDYYSDLESVAKRYAELAPPWHDELMLDQSEDGVYSIHCARWISWTQRFYNVKGFMPWCDYKPFDTFNDTTEDGKGITPEMETRYFRSVTGVDMTWEDLLEMGRKIWNLKRAILVLNGRHRNEEYFPPYPPYNSYVYTEGPPTLQWGAIIARTHTGGFMGIMGGGQKKGERFRNFDLKSRTDVMEPSGLGGGHAQTRYGVYKNGKWEWSIELFHLKKDRMDEFKTLFYDLEGWDTETGWPTRTALEECGLKEMAVVLEKHGKSLKP